MIKIGKEITMVQDSTNSNIWYIEGESTQETRSGKNLFGLTVDDYLNGTVLGNGKYVTLTLKPNTKYTLSSNEPNGTNWATNIWFNGTDSYVDGVDINRSKTTTTDENGNLYISIRTNLIEEIFSKYWIQLEEGTEATEYEPYGASPSPDFPSPILSNYPAGIYQTTINGTKYIIKLEDDLRGLSDARDRLELDISTGLCTRRNNIASVEVYFNSIIGTGRGVVETPNKIYNNGNRIMCTNAKVSSSMLENTIYENPANCVIVGNENDTLESFKAKFDGSIVIYQLAEETTEDVPCSKLSSNNVKAIHYSKQSKNLFQLNDSQTKNGVTVTNNGDGTITLNGTATATMDLWIANGTSLTPTLRVSVPANTYITKALNEVSGTKIGNIELKVIVVYDNIQHWNDFPAHMSTYVNTRDVELWATELYIPIGASFDNYTIFPQLEFGTVATTPEMYAKELLEISKVMLGANLIWQKEQKHTDNPIPTTWTNVTDNSYTSGDWAIRSTTPRGNQTVDLAFDGDLTTSSNYSATTSYVYLTPPTNLKISKMKLDVQLKYGAIAATCSLQVSTDNGSTWNDLLTISNTDHVLTEFELPSFDYGQRYRLYLKRSSTSGYLRIYEWQISEYYTK